MKAKIIDGHYLAELKRQEIQHRIVRRLKNNKRAPGLAVIQIGSDPASTIYVSNKQKACKEVGIISFVYNFEDITTELLLKLIMELNNKPDVDGILLQLPLPAHIDTKRVMDHIHPTKDVDGLHPYNIGRLCQGDPKIRPCTSYGVVVMLTFTNVPLTGLNAVIVGASTMVGKPMAMELLLLGCTTTIAHSKTEDLSSHIANADIVVAAVGQEDLIKGHWIKPGAIVIDVGINRLPSGKIVGDVEFSVAIERAGWITPVPGGVGPMTVAMLLSNTLYACENQESVQS